MFRRRRARQQQGVVIDLTVLEPRWRSAVEETLASRGRLDTFVQQCADGPLRERLSSLVARVDAGVTAAWTIALRAQTASQALRAMGPEEATEHLKTARRRLNDAKAAGADTSALEAEVQMLADQHASLSGLANAVEDAGERLRLLDLRLDAAVARAATISLRPDALEAMAGVDAELQGVLDELDALRAGLDAVSAH